MNNSFKQININYDGESPPIFKKMSKNSIFKFAKYPSVFTETNPSSVATYARYVCVTEDDIYVGIIYPSELPSYPYYTWDHRGSGSFIENIFHHATLEEAAIHLFTERL